MIYPIWLLLILMSVAVDLLGLVVVPIAIWRSDGKSLPHWARWWDNDAEPLGDQDRRPPIEAATGLWRGFLRWRWLCLRNPGNNFGRIVGFVQSADVEYVLRGDAKTSDQGHPGWLFVRAYRQHDLSAFCFYGVCRWGKSRCVRVFIGWKIHGNVAPEQYAKNVGKPAQIVGVINPFMTFEERAI